MSEPVNPIDVTEGAFIRPDVRVEIDEDGNEIIVGYPSSGGSGGSGYTQEENVAVRRPDPAPFNPSI